MKRGEQNARNVPHCPHFLNLKSEMKQMRGEKGFRINEEQKKKKNTSMNNFSLVIFT